MNYRNTLVATIDIRTGKRPDGIAWLHDTAKLHGIEITTMNDGKWISLYDNKIPLFYRWAQQHKSDFIIFVDGDDTLFATDLAEMHRRFETYNTDFVLGGEPNCFPWLERKARVPGDGKFRFPNSGFFMATWAGFVRCFEAVQSMGMWPAEYAGVEDNDQSYWMLAKMERKFEYTVDEHCRLSQCLYELDWRWTPHNRDIMWGKRPRNLITGSYPCTLHGNGPDKWRLKDLHEMLTG